MIRHKIFYSFVVMLGLLSFAACQDDPNFPLEPRISYLGYEQEVVTNPTQGIIDSIIFVVRFQDGDGNLGLENDRTKYPEDFEGLFADGQPYHNNFLAIVERKVGNSYEPVLLPSGSPLVERGRFPRVSTDGRIEPLEGDIRYNRKFYKNTTGNILKNGDIIRFRIRIFDRALNESNEVTSEDITIKY